MSGPTLAAQKWRIVPVEPTEEMLLAMAAAPKWSWSHLTVESATERYRSLLAAAPDFVADSFDRTTVSYLIRTLYERAASFGNMEGRYYGKSDTLIDEQAARKLEALANDLAAAEIDAETMARHANEADNDADGQAEVAASKAVALVVRYLRNLPPPVAMDWTFADAGEAIERGDHLLEWEDEAS